MMERGSSLWWFVLLLLAMVSVRWDRAMQFHVQESQSNMEHTTRLELEAERLNHTAITHKLQSVLNRHQSEALHREALKLYNRSKEEEALYEQEEKLALEYEKLFEKANEASEQCEVRMELDVKISQEAREELKRYLDDVARLKQLHEGFCIEHWWTPMWYCDLVARWTGLDKKQQNAFVDAKSMNSTYIDAAQEEKLDESLEEELAKNVTRFSHLTVDAEDEANQLKKSSIRDEQRAEELEANATNLLNSSREESNAATMEEKQAEQARLEAEGFLKLAQSYGKKARSLALLATVSGVLVLCAMLTHIVHLCLSMMPAHDAQQQRQDEDDDLAKPYYDDEHTVASTITSESSPLVSHASPEGSDISYLTVDLDSRTTSTNSSISFLSSAAISQIVHDALDVIHFHAQKIELVGAVLVVALLGHVIWSDTLPGLCVTL